MSTLKEIEVQNIDHLGIVAGIIDSIGLVEIVNELLGEECCRKNQCWACGKSNDFKWFRLCISTIIYVFKVF